MSIYIHINGGHMASKNIAITEDIYHELLKRKHNDESFTKIISRLIQENDRPSNYFGKWKDITEKEEQGMNKAKSELRKLWTDRNIT